MIFFDNIIKRVSNFSIQSYELNKKDIYKFYESNELFKVCVLTASESLYNELNKNNVKKTEGSLYNYFARAHTNPTPFGVFNSVGVLKWGEETNVLKNEKLSFFVKYDNLFLSTKINEDFDENWMQLSFCLNPSIHFVQDKKVGFYKSELKENDRIEIVYNEIDVDDDTLWLFDQFKNGNKILTVINELEKQGFVLDEIKPFLMDIIEAGLVIETFLFNSYTSKLNCDYQRFFSELISQKKHDINNLNDILNFRNSYVKEQEDLFNKDNKPKNFYAINSFDFDDNSLLSKDVQSQIKKYIDFAIHYNSGITPLNAKLDEFIKKVHERFNDGFVSFNEVFNPYSGVNFNEIEVKNELKLHEDIFLKILSSNDKNLFLNLSVNENINFKETKVPATFTVILEMLTDKETGDSITYIRNIGYSSALDIISRFSDVTHEACQDIINYEKEVNKDKIIADINCVGNFRSVNVAATEQRFDYSLPINTAYQEESNPVFLSDLFLHLEGNKLALVSGKHKKQVMPKRVSAVNSRLLKSDIYNFLAAYECYNQEIHPVSFDFNSYPYRLAYIPRIYLCEGVLISPAQLLLVYNNFDIVEFKNYLDKKIEEHSFSKKIVITESSREIVYDLENQENVAMLYDKIKNRKHFYVSEFIYEAFLPKIENKTENFAHELVVGVKNPYYKRESADYSKMNIEKYDSNNAAILSDWLYLEVYCNSQADPEIFNDIYQNIILEDLADQFFFVNYYNPDRHIRLRFKTKDIVNKQKIISVIDRLRSKSLISLYKILPYKQELHRYGGVEIMKLTEKIFDLDSRDFLENIGTKNLSKKELKIAAILKLRNYLYFFNFPLDNAIEYCERCILNFSSEFELTSELRKEFNKEYSEIRNDLFNGEFETFLNEEDFRVNFYEESQKNNIDSNRIFWSIIHMSMNRHFDANQRFNEFKTYYLTKSYLNQLKFTKIKEKELKEIEV